MATTGYRDLVVITPVEWATVVSGVFAIKPLYLTTIECIMCWTNCVVLDFVCQGLGNMWLHSTANCSGPLLPASR